MDSKLDLCAITETWLNINDGAVRNEVCPSNYVLLDQPRAGHRRGGGTAFMYRESLFHVKKLHGGELNSFEFSEYSVRSKHQNLRVIVIYRRPYSDDHKVLTATFLNEFSNYIEMKVLCREELLLLGDFNIRVDALDDSVATKFSDLLESLGLVQHVEHATRVHGHT